MKPMTLSRPRSTAGKAAGPQAATDPRSQTVGILLNRVAKAWREELDRRLRPLGLTRVTWQALLVLARAEAPLTQRALGNALDIGAPATVALLDRMERDGLVERAAVPGDRRRHAVRVTGSSRELLTRIEDTAGTLRREILGGLTRQEVAQLHGLLAKAHARIESVRAGDAA
jgi:MarR family transcriptional regulator for hemolysin